MYQSLVCCVCLSVVCICGVYVSHIVYLSVEFVWRCVMRIYVTVVCLNLVCGVRLSVVLAVLNNLKIP